MDVKKVRAVGHWVIVKVDPPERISEGGIYLPEGNLQERKSMATGTVLSAGRGKIDGKVFLEMPVKTGDRIVFRGFLQEAKRIGEPTDREHCVLHMDDILGVLED